MWNTNRLCVFVLFLFLIEFKQEPFRYTLDVSQVCCVKVYPHVDSWNNTYTVFQTGNIILFFNRETGRVPEQRRKQGCVTLPRQPEAG